MDKLDMQVAEEIYEQVDLEQTILKRMLETLDAYEAGGFTVSISPIKQLLSKIENTDFASVPSKTAKRTAKIARYLFTILSDLRFLVKESQNSPNKEILLKEIDGLISKVKKLLDNYYYYYQYVPEPRYIEKWYYGYRDHYKFLPYYDYYRYYQQMYPDKRKYLSAEESIWLDVTHGESNLSESTLFVPKSFQGNQSEYDEFCIWKARKELEHMRSSHYNKTPLELQRESDKLLDVADKIIQSERRRFMQ
jgi:hypothetical protein